MENVKKFIEEIQSVPQMVCEAQLQTSKSEDEKIIIQSFLPILDTQFKSISREIDELLPNATKSSLSEVDKFLRLSGANQIVPSLKMALPSIGSLIGKLGIDEIIKAIKKIIKAIIDIIKNGFKDWWPTLENIIDELIALLFGGESASDKAIFSLAEQNFLEERTKVVKFENALMERNNNIKED